jgi:hypothetical protein
MSNHPTNSSQVVSQELIEFLTLRYTIAKFHRMGVYASVFIIRCEERYCASDRSGNNAIR